MHGLQCAPPTINAQQCLCCSATFADMAEPKVGFHTGRSYCCTTTQSCATSGLLAHGWVILNWTSAAVPNNVSKNEQNAYPFLLFFRENQKLEHSSIAWPKQRNKNFQAGTPEWGLLHSHNTVRALDYHTSVLLLKRENWYVVLEG